MSDGCCDQVYIYGFSNTMNQPRHHKAYRYEVLHVEPSKGLQRERREMREGPEKNVPEQALNLCFRGAVCRRPVTGKQTSMKASESKETLWKRRGQRQRSDVHCMGAALILTHLWLSLCIICF
jgi:hypothetical protein